MARNNIKNTPAVLRSLEDAHKVFLCDFFTPMETGSMYGPDEKVVPMGNPGLFIDNPGTGKSQVVLQWLRNIRKPSGQPIKVVKFEPGCMGEGAVGTTPVPINYKHPKTGKEMTVLDFPPPKVFIDADDGDMAIYLDELTTVDSSAMMNALLTLLQSGRIGAHQLNPLARRIGAGNPTDQTAAGERLTLPVVNRLGHYLWPTPRPAEWSDFMLGTSSKGEEEYIDVTEMNARVLRTFRERTYPQAVGQYVSWVQRRPEMLNNMPEAGSDGAIGPWSSCRSNTSAVHGLATAMAMGLGEELQNTVMEARIGQVAVNDFFTWRQNMDLPDPTALLDGKVTFTPNARRADRTYAVINSCVAVLTDVGVKQRKRKFTNFMHLLNSTADESADLVVRPVKALMEIKEYAKLANNSDDVELMDVIDNAVGKYIAIRDIGS